MVRTPVLECSFLIPIHRDPILSDGRPHHIKAWRRLSEGLYQRFEGWTLSPGLHSGAYQDPDTLRPVRDRCRKYTVAVSKSDIEGLREFLAKACIRFRQKCIYLSIAGQVEFIEAPEHGPS